MLQSYTLLHKTSGNENISVLNFIKSNNLKVDGYKNSVRTAFLPNSNAISIYLSVFILSQHQGSPYQRTSSRNLSLP